MSLSKDLRKLQRIAKKAGWRIRRSGGDHLKWYPPDGGSMLVTGTTLSDHRSIHNIRAALRRRGLPLPH